MTDDRETRVIQLEELREALERWERSERGLSRGVSFTDIGTIAAAARAYLELQEGEPDYEAGGRRLHNFAHSKRTEGTVNCSACIRNARVVVDAAIGRPPIEEER